MTSSAVFWVAPDTAARNAGFRIRTQPLVNALVERGKVVQAISQAELIARFSEIAGSAGLVIVAKPSDTMIYLCLKALSNRKVPVVIDLYDNYFSWSPAVSKRQVHWHWLRNLKIAALAVTSTAYLEGVVRTLRDGPVVRVSDPLPHDVFSAEDQEHIRHKWPLRGHLDVLWFGISSNPYYLAGLDDVSDWWRVVGALRDRLVAGCELRVTICTNRVPGVEAVLGMLRREGVNARYVEWSEAACASLQAQAHVVLLPTNLTGFSLSKTHNRCSDALARGCLVLASPNGPYRQIGGAVFLAVDELARTLRDHGGDPTAMMDATLESLTELSRWADIEANADRLLAALEELAKPPAHRPAEMSPQVLVVGRTRVDTVKFSRTLNYLIAGFTESSVKATLDIAVTLQGAGLQPGLVWIKISRKAWDVVLAMMSANWALDVAESDTHLRCRSDGWHFVFDKNSMVCTVVAGPDERLLRELEVVRELPADAPHSLDRWYDTMVEMLVQVLSRLGFRHLDFGADDHGGWSKFAQYADPQLAESERRLRALWQRHDGHEIEWVPDCEDATE